MSLECKACDDPSTDETGLCPHCGGAFHVACHAVSECIASDVECDDFGERHASGCCLCPCHVTAGMRMLTELAPALEVVRLQLDADALLDPTAVDAWQALDATQHMGRLFGLVDGLRDMPEFSVGDIRDGVAAITIAGLMVLTQLARQMAGVPHTPRPEPSRIARVH